MRSLTTRLMQVAAPRESAPASLLSFIGTLFFAVSVGPLVILVNGGYSIVGMEWLAGMFGAYGRLFWALATTYTVAVPVAARAGLPLQQPVIPWLFVLAISCLQISMIIRRLRGDRSAPLYDRLGEGVSVFDYATTAIGMAFAPFTAGLFVLVHIVWIVVAFCLAVPITFLFEWLIAGVLRGRGGSHAGNQSVQPY